MMKILYKKTNFKKVGFSTMACTAKILSWRFRHLNIVGCLLIRRPTKGGGGVHGHPRTPPTDPLICIILHVLLSLIQQQWNLNLTNLYIRKSSV